MVKAIHFQEGDLVNKGQTVVEFWTKRFELLIKRAEDRLKVREAELKSARREADLKRKLLSDKATTSADVLRVETDAETAEHRVHEARDELELARVDLDSCRIKSPYTGYLAVRHVEPSEARERFTPLFTIVDTSRFSRLPACPKNIFTNSPKVNELPSCTRVQERATRVP